MKYKLVSVIVPVYNVEKYIEKCIKSILEQTYSNFELIIVNDGSPDNCLEICKKYSKKDKRIKLISQKNGGLSSARNTGIKNSTGEYLLFVDSDDYISKDYIEKLYEQVEKNNADICCCNYYFENEDGKIWNQVDKEHLIFNNMEAINDIFVGNQKLEIMVWNKIYKKSLFVDNNIFFPEGKIHEDNFTTYKLFYYSNKIVLINDRLYYYLQRKTSIMGEKFNEKRLDILAAINETYSFFESVGVDISCSIECYEIKLRINLYNNMVKDNYKNTTKYHKYIKNRFKKYNKNSYLSLKFRIMLFLICYFKNLYTFILKFRSGV